MSALVTAKLYKRGKSDAPKEWMQRDFSFDKATRILSYSSKNCLKGSIKLHDVMKARPFNTSTNLFGIDVRCYKIFPDGKIDDIVKSFILAADNADAQQYWIQVLNEGIEMINDTARSENVIAAESTVKVEKPMNKFQQFINSRNKPAVTDENRHQNSGDLIPEVSPELNVAVSAPRLSDSVNRRQVPASPHPPLRAARNSSDVVHSEISSMSDDFLSDSPAMPSRNRDSFSGIFGDGSTTEDPRRKSLSARSVVLSKFQSPQRLRLSTGRLSIGPSQGNSINHRAADKPGSLGIATPRIVLDQSSASVNHTLDYTTLHPDAIDAIPTGITNPNLSPERNLVAKRIESFHKPAVDTSQDFPQQRAASSPRAASIVDLQQQLFSGASAQEVSAAPREGGDVTLITSNIVARNRASFESSRRPNVSRDSFGGGAPGSRSRPLQDALGSRGGGPAPSPQRVPQLAPLPIFSRSSSTSRGQSQPEVSHSSSQSYVQPFSPRDQSASSADSLPPTTPRDASDSALPPIVPKKSAVKDFMNRMPRSSGMFRAPTPDPSSGAAGSVEPAATAVPPVNARFAQFMNATKKADSLTSPRETDSSSSSFASSSSSSGQEQQPLLVRPRSLSRVRSFIDDGAVENERRRAAQDEENALREDLLIKIQFAHRQIQFLETRIIDSNLLLPPVTNPDQNDAGEGTARSSDDSVDAGVPANIANSYFSQSHVGQFLSYQQQQSPRLSSASFNPVARLSLAGIGRSPATSPRKTQRTSRSVENDDGDAEDDIASGEAVVSVDDDYLASCFPSSDGPLPGEVDSASSSLYLSRIILDGCDATQPSDALVENYVELLTRPMANARFQNFMKSREKIKSNQILTSKLTQQQLDEESVQAEQLMKDIQKAKLRIAYLENTVKKYNL